MEEKKNLKGRVLFAGQLEAIKTGKNHRRGKKSSWLDQFTALKKLTSMFSPPGDHQQKSTAPPTPQPDWSTPLPLISPIIIMIIIIFLVVFILIIPAQSLACVFSTAVWTDRMKV